VISVTLKPSSCLVVAIETLCYTPRDWLGIIFTKSAPMLPEWGQVGFLLLISLIFPIGGIGTSWLLGRLGVRPDHPDQIKEETYECGVETEGTAWVQFNFRYYYFALLFVIFDVEAVFLYPWAVSFQRVAATGFIEVLTFVLILLIGLLYAWRKDALEWT
jgi:NADH:ubiquinone oxidoreductase subunit 3 (subunit A)